MSGNMFKRNYREDQLQMEVIRYLKLQYPDVLVHHCANERQTSPQRGAKLKKMGVRAGCPDILIFKKSGNVSGLAIELKIGKNKPTEAQNDFLNRLSINGWFTKVSYNFDAAKTIIDNYLSTNKS